LQQLFHVSWNKRRVGTPGGRSDDRIFLYELRYAQLKESGTASVAYRELIAKEISRLFGIKKKLLVNDDKQPCHVLCTPQPVGTD